MTEKVEVKLLEIYRKKLLEYEGIIKDLRNDLFKAHEKLRNMPELNASSLGKRGGQKTASLYGKEHFKKIAKGWPKGKKRKIVTEIGFAT